MHLYFKIRNCGFQWMIWTPDMNRAELIVFHLSLYWRSYKPKRMWALSATMQEGLVYRDIRNSEQTQWHMQTPIRFEKYAA